MADNTLKCRCMMCGHEYEDVPEDHERSCPKCRSNSIRHIKDKPKKDKE